MGRPTVTAFTFWNRVRQGEENECWFWTGTVSPGKRNKDPYGRCDAFGVTGAYVHRIAYWLANGGPMCLRKTDFLIRHKCDNPLCCNPKHLLAGTHEDNMQDMLDRGRQTAYVSVESPNAKLTTEQVHEIRAQPKELRRALAERYGVSIQTIKAVRSGRHYSDI